METFDSNRWNDSDFKSVLSIFEEISSIPRCSKNEEQIASWLEKFGQDRGFETKRDHCNNVVIQVPASTGMESLPTVVLQAHTDMVCEKEAGTPHNFTTDSLSLHYIEENGVPFLTAEKTTLGADNGIGMAYMLAVAASENIPHPRLELLFTTDEEVGLTGAQGMNADFISGSYLINLDSEEEGVIIIGCAGGTQIGFKRLIDVEDACASDDAEGTDCDSTLLPYTVAVSGLLGGHSGTDIHIGRGNANRILISFFTMLAEKYPQNRMKLIKIKGGTASNTIPRHAELSFVTDISAENLKNEAAIFVENTKAAAGFNDPDLAIGVSDLNFSKDNGLILKAFSIKNTGRIMSFLSAIPNGVFEMSASIPDLVSVSGNLAMIRTKSSAEYFKGTESDIGGSDLDIYTEKSKRELEITLSLRSGIESKLKDKIREMMAFSEKYHFNFEITHTYSPWEADFNSDFLKSCADIYARTFGKEVQITAIHAGLECGVFRRTFPSMKMISIGPDIIGAHTPDEKLNLDAAEKVWIYLKEILKSFPSANANG
ncbi:beta-Ala-His dipeptidase [Methanimicrococcus blatticola]|uniref:Dipeptidase D n=1 Tax=Methanimicrococcus blatticola TaxID=91560 RepID=A0A484F347_9EURY|nr:beta-Ala-His dipeptidase [Methanimicrococcus blatticola]MBZ3935968.1 beta-Ala-His dipeptidase [Methanimicrococcus blatticola]MCC2509419.1 beta-Ala-His dipeptidase [Methanimicrococcus blatticola]TDQ68300.1 dipeptidase D [Methanimicrococcus blatticola]